MHLRRIQIALTLVMLASSTFAASPFEISGFTTDLIFSQALEKARKLGGICQIIPLPAPEGGTSAQCEYAACSSRDKAGACDPQEGQATGLTIAAQPIRQIVLEAPTDTAPLTRIIFGYEGRYESVAEGLKQAFGPPSGDAAQADRPSWTHARRLGWTQGRYRVGIVNIPKLIIMVADQGQE
jgi:hypothetical protein